MRLLIAALLLGWCFTSSVAQTIENVKASLQDGKITVVYDLTGGKPNQRYSVQLYASHNNFTSPLTQVTGDVGQNIAPGKEKKIEWNTKAEVDELKGNITFRVKAELIPFPFSFKSPIAGTSVRRGKETLLQWEGGKPDQSVHLELFKNVERVTSVAETKNNGQFTWSVPKDLSKGNYTLKLTSGKESVNSGEFSLKSKIPLAVKVLPILVIGGVVAATSGGGGTKDQTPPASSDLPAAPGPH